MRIIIPGKPFGKQRKITNRRGITYMPKETLLYENHVRACYINAAKLVPPSSAPVVVELNAYFSIPVSWSKKKKAAAPLTPYTGKPDNDNIQKIVFDALNGLAWVDDKQVYDVRCIKLYDNTPRIELEISFDSPMTRLEFLSPEELPF